MATTADSKTTVVILIHGIRTAARWQNRVAALIEKETGATVIPLKYGYFDLLRFLCPFGICRHAPIERLRKQIEGIRAHYEDARLVVFAHSFGTYALSQILLDNPHFKFDRVLLCGSIIPENYAWSRIENQILAAEKRDAIINDCGTRDIWPVFARSVSWGYGASGTYGFGSYNVRDRFHPLKHSEFFEEKFVQTYWVPAVMGAKADFSPGDKQEAKSPTWYNFLQLPLRWLLPVGVVVAGLALLVPLLPLLQGAGPCPPDEEQRAGICVRVADLKSRKELDERISTLLHDVTMTLDLKGGVLFPAMDEYVFSPTPEKWAAVFSTAEKLLQQLDKGLNDISEYNAYLAAGEPGKFWLITKDAAIPVDERFFKAFEDVRRHFRGRSTLLSEMKSAGPQPDAAKVTEWRTRLETLHDQLQNTLQELVGLLTSA